MRIEALCVYIVAVLAIVAGMMGLSHILGQTHRERATHEVYESGIRVTGSARVRLAAPFYLIAMLFVIFDLEAAYLFAWAVAFHRLGWGGFVGALIFIAVLSVALLYEWRQGALDWAAKRRHASSSARVGPPIRGGAP